MEKISANIGTRLFYPKNILHGMIKDLLKTKIVNNFGFVTVNGAVCLSVCHKSWNSSFKCSPANQSTVWD